MPTKMSFDFFHGGPGDGRKITIVATTRADAIRVYDLYDFPHESRNRFRTHWSRMPFKDDRGIPYKRGAYLTDGKKVKEAKRRED